MSIGSRVRAGALTAGLFFFAAAAAPASDHREAPTTREVLWLLVFLRIDGFTSSEVLATEQKCEEVKLAEMLERRPSWKPEVTMISDCVPVRLHDIRPKSPRGRSP